MLKTIISVFLLCIASVNAYAQWTSGSCVSAYSSCTAAGYEREDTEGYTCTTSAKVYIISGTEAVETTCYKGCTELATDCLAAGYYTYSSTDSYYYYNEITIPGVSGNLTCYQNRSRYYSSCTAANSSYKDSKTNYCGCSAVTIYTSKTGATKTCYSGCKAVCLPGTYQYTSAPTNGYLSGDSCTGPTGISGSTCNNLSVVAYTAIGCNSGYCLLNGACYTVCDSSTYKYTSAPSHATLSGTYCTGYTGTSGGACSGSSLKRYTSFTCNSGYCMEITNAGSKLETKTCVAACDSSTYKYSQISNATMSNPCTGYYNSGTKCESTKSTKYSSFTCNSGYYKVGNSCLKSTSSSGGGSDNCTGGGKILVNGVCKTCQEAGYCWNCYAAGYTTNGGCINNSPCYGNNYCMTACNPMPSTQYPSGYTGTCPMATNPAKPSSSSSSSSSGLTTSSGLNSGLNSGTQYP